MGRNCASLTEKSQHIQIVEKKIFKICNHLLCPVSIRHVIDVVFMSVRDLPFINYDLGVSANQTHECVKFCYSPLHELHGNQRPPYANCGQFGYPPQAIINERSLMLQYHVGRTGCLQVYFSECKNLDTQVDLCRTTVTFTKVNQGLNKDCSDVWLIIDQS